MFFHLVELSHHFIPWICESVGKALDDYLAMDLVVQSTEKFYSINFPTGILLFRLLTIERSLFLICSYDKEDYSRKSENVGEQLA